MKKSKDEPELAASTCGILSWLPHRYEISSSQLLKQEWFDQVVLEIEMASLHPKSLKPDSRQAAQLQSVRNAPSNRHQLSTCNTPKAALSGQGLCRILSIVR